jgi:hypothetical protein
MKRRDLRLADGAATKISASAAGIGTNHGGNYKAVKKEDRNSDCE